MVYLAVFASPIDGRSVARFKTEIEMMDSNPGHSTDLEWLLQSGEASQATIIQYLLHETYVPLYHLLGALLGQAAAAQKAAVEIYVAALSQTRAYQGDISVKEWLAALALRTLRLGRSSRERRSWTASIPFLRGLRPSAKPLIPNTGILQNNPLRALDDLSDEIRIPWILHVIYRLNSTQIGRILGLNREEVEANIRSARAGSVYGTHLLISTPPEVIDARVLEGWQKRWQATAPLAPNYDRLSEQIEARVRSHRRQGQRRRALRDGLLLGLGIIGVLLIIRVQSMRLPDPVSRPGFGPAGMATATPAPRPTASSESVSPSRRYTPLTETSDIRQIRQHILNSTHWWRTLWADALVIHYGPQAYIGPPLVYRNQVWISQPDHALVLGGPNEGAPEFLRLIDEVYTYEVDLVHHITFDDDQPSAALAELELPFLKKTWETSGASAPSQYGFYLYDLLRPADAWWPLGDLRVVGMDVIAGREALIVEWSSQRSNISPRLWVDTETGIILRLWLNNGEIPGRVEMEIRLTNLVLHATIPTDFFNLDSAWFEQPRWGQIWQPTGMQVLPPAAEITSLAGRQPVPLNPPPAKIDLSGGPLSFQWINDLQDPTRPGDWADLILDGYWLGSAEMGSPWSISCERSASGRYLAFARGYTTVFGQAEGLRWIDLNQTRPFHDPLPNGTVSGDFAFSPDSKRLAFHGCAGSQGNCGVFLHDLATGKNVKLATMGIAGHFVWSPDGSQLALVGRFGEDVEHSNWEMMVLQVDSGKVQYRAVVDINRMTLPVDLPMRSWNVDFPPPTQSLDGCR